MMKWFTSLDGTITLTAIALLSLIGRTFVDFQFVYPEFASGALMAGLSVLSMVALFGGFLWGLLAATRGSRGGLIACLIFTVLLSLGGGIGTLVSLCPSPCQTAWPVMEIANWSNLLTGALAVSAQIIQLRQGKPSA
jgi:hypothetical protein